MHIISYSDSTFRRPQLVQSVRAAVAGFVQISQFSESNLPEDFRKKNAETLSMKRGAGYWIWKPTIILQYALLLESNSELMYLDSGALTRRDVRQYSNLICDDRIHVWEVGNQKISQWTEPEVLESLNISQITSNSPMIWAGALVTRKSEILIEFLKVWESLCSNPKYLRPETFSSYRKPNGLIWHRHDQSLLSIIVAQNPDWFHVHPVSEREQNWEYFFDRHRKLAVHYILIVYSFPEFRKLRQRLSRALPKRLRSNIRILIDKLGAKELSKSEIDSMRDNFY